MKICDVLINGRENPVGINFEQLSCSWKVEDAQGTRQKNARIEVSKQEDFADIYYCKEGETLSSIAESIEVELTPCTRYYVRISVESELGETAIDTDTFFETGKREEPWYGKWITTQHSDFHPEFKKEFYVDLNWIYARLYISGLGLFEAYLNGEKVGDDYLAPFCNDYKEGVQYCTYDITSQLSNKNKLVVLLGNGWYKGRLGYTGMQAVYGDEFQVCAELHIVYKNGKKIVIPTDSTWEYRGAKLQKAIFMMENIGMSFYGKKVRIHGSKL